MRQSLAIVKLDLVKCGRLSQLGWCFGRITFPYLLTYSEFQRHSAIARGRIVFIVLVYSVEYYVEY